MEALRGARAHQSHRQHRRYPSERDVLMILTCRRQPRRLGVEGLKCQQREGHGFISWSVSWFFLYVGKSYLKVCTEKETDDFLQ